MRWRAAGWPRSCRRRKHVRRKTVAHAITIRKIRHIEGYMDALRTESRKNVRRIRLLKRCAA